MALIKCSDCHEMISDKAKACPHCGCPISSETEAYNLLYNALLAQQKGDYSTFFALAMRSANMDYPEAMYFLGSAYMEGIGVPVNENEAIEWWLKAANRGDAPSMYNVAVGLYNQGEMDRASFYCRSAIEKGYQVEKANSLLNDILDAQNSNRFMREFSDFMRRYNQT